MCRNSLLLLLGGLILLMPAMAFGQPEDLSQCSRIESATERLRCYDEHASRAAPQTAPNDTRSTRSDERASEGAPQTAPNDTRSSPSDAQVDTAPQTSATDTRSPPSDEHVEAATANEEAQFGQEARKRRESRTLNAITSRIVEVKTAPLGNRIMTLENGQVWRENEPGRVRIEAGSEVTIGRGTFRSFTMLIKGSRTIRVHRVQ